MNTPLTTSQQRIAQRETISPTTAQQQIADRDAARSAKIQNMQGERIDKLSADMDSLKANQYAAEEKSGVSIAHGSPSWVMAESKAYPVLWDLISVKRTARTFTIIGDADAEVDLEGTMTFVSAGTGFGTSGNNFVATALAATEGTHYVYLTVTLSTGACTINHGTSLPASGALTQVYPLWKLEVSATPFVITTAKDLRPMKELRGGSASAQDALDGINGLDQVAGTPTTVLPDANAVTPEKYTVEWRTGVGAHAGELGLYGSEDQLAVNSVPWFKGVTEDKLQWTAINSATNYKVLQVYAGELVVDWTRAH